MNKLRKRKAEIERERQRRGLTAEQWVVLSNELAEIELALKESDTELAWRWHERESAA